MDEQEKIRRSKLFPPYMAEQLLDMALATLDKFPSDYAELRKKAMIKGTRFGAEKNLQFQEGRFLSYPSQPEWVEVFGGSCQSDLLMEPRNQIMQLMISASMVDVGGPDGSPPRPHAMPTMYKIGKFWQQVGERAGLKQNDSQQLTPNEFNMTLNFINGENYYGIIEFHIDDYEKVRNAMLELQAEMKTQDNIAQHTEVVERITYGNSTPTGWKR